MLGKIYTSNLQGLERLPEPAKKFLITRAGPDVDEFTRIREMTPSPQLFNRYLTEWKGQMSPDIWWPQYTVQFKTQFKDPVMLNELRKLYRMLLQGDNLLLVCYCKDWHYCHRRLIADFYRQYGVEVIELSPVEYDEIWLDI